MRAAASQGGSEARRKVWRKRGRSSPEGLREPGRTVCFTSERERGLPSGAPACPPLALSGDWPVSPPREPPSSGLRIRSASFPLCSTFGTQVSAPGTFLPRAVGCARSSNLALRTKERKLFVPLPGARALGGARVLGAQGPDCAQDATSPRAARVVPSPRGEKARFVALFEGREISCSGAITRGHWLPAGVACPRMGGANAYAS